MEEAEKRGPCHRQTLCWDCANATGGCSWADHNEHKQVPGWEAIETTIRIHNPSCDAEATKSYIVLSCPEFIRDAEGHGLRKVGQEQPKNHRCGVDPDAIITAYQCGVSIKEISETTGHAESTIRIILDDAGIKRAKKKISASTGWAEAARKRG